MKIIYLRLVCFFRKHIWIRVKGRNRKYCDRCKKVGRRVDWLPLDADTTANAIVTRRLLHNRMRA